jgi:hypothetical protein
MLRWHQPFEQLLSLQTLFPISYGFALANVKKPSRWGWLFTSSLLSYWIYAESEWIVD